MRLIRTSGDKLLFHLGQREKQALGVVLKLYPRIPSAHQPLSKTATLPDQDAAQRLLDEALAEQRAENKNKVRAFLANPKRFSVDEKGWRLTLSPVDVEWLLQILNDIRVGSWIILGAPEEKEEELNETTAPHIWAMEVSGYFQMGLLEALGKGG